VCDSASKHEMSSTHEKLDISDVPQLLRQPLELNWGGLIYGVVSCSGVFAKVICGNRGFSFREFRI
jgi:hypothetical protein